MSTLSFTINLISVIELRHNRELIDNVLFVVMSRLRMGLVFAFAALGALFGTPIDGKLLGDEFHWSRAIIFSGVVVLAGSAALVGSRILFVRQRGTSRV